MHRILVAVTLEVSSVGLGLASRLGGRHRRDLGCATELTRDVPKEPAPNHCGSLWHAEMTRGTGGGSAAPIGDGSRVQQS